MSYVYDTNIFIYHFKRFPEVGLFFHPLFFENNQVLVSTVTRIELLSYPDLPASEEKEINELLSFFTIVPITPDIEDVTIQLRRKYKLKLPDAIIGATALQYSATLFTNNTKDFKHIHEIKIETPTRKK